MNANQNCNSRLFAFIRGQLLENLVGVLAQARRSGFGRGVRLDFIDGTNGRQAAILVSQEFEPFGGVSFQEDGLYALLHFGLALFARKLIRNEIVAAEGAAQIGPEFRL
jgi:hypothetical protein